MLQVKFLYSSKEAYRMIKGVKIRETFEDFLEEHPELKITKDKTGHIISIIFPKEATETSYTIVYGEVVRIYYKYKEQSISFFI